MTGPKRWLDQDRRLSSSSSKRIIRMFDCVSGAQILSDVFLRLAGGRPFPFLLCDDVVFFLTAALSPGQFQTF